VRAAWKAAAVVDEDFSKAMTKSTGREQAQVVGGAKVAAVKVG